MKRLRGRRWAAEGAAVQCVWLALLAWSAQAISFVPAPWTFEGVFEEELKLEKVGIVDAKFLHSPGRKSDTSLSLEARIPVANTTPNHAEDESADQSNSWTTDKSHKRPKRLYEVSIGSTHPPYMKGRRIWSHPLAFTYNFAAISWGPGFFLYATVKPYKFGPTCLMMHYTRRLRGNESQNQPVWMRDAQSCLQFYLQDPIDPKHPERKPELTLVHYPGVPCPEFLTRNYMCHLMGDHIAVQPWERWADYNMYHDLYQLHFTSKGEESEQIDFPDTGYYVPFKYPVGRRVYTVRIHNCDPTRNCIPFPKKDSDTINIEFGTTNTSKIDETTTTTTQSTTPRTSPTTKVKWKKKREMKCVEKPCGARMMAKKLWPIFFVTTLIVLFGILPCIYFCAKSRTERALLQRWHNVSSPDERVNILMQVPPTWAPGWPPGPSTGEPSRTDPEGKWRRGDTEDFGTRSRGGGPPAAKRRKRS